MAQPTTYNRAYSFTSFQSSSPSDPLPAAQVDAEFNLVKQTLDEILNNLALIQRDDGEVANATIGYEQLTSGVLAGIEAPTTWVTATDYALNDTVFNDYAFYICATAHTSGTFATDLAAEKWTLIADFGTAFSDASDAQTAAEAAQAAAEAAQALAEAAAVSTAADVISTAADAASTAADAISTAADAVSTAADVVSTGADVVAAAASEANALAYASRYKGTSTTSVTIGTGSQGPFTTQADKFFDVGVFVTIVSDAAPSTDWMFAQVTAYSGTSLTVNVISVGGSGAHTDWTITVSGARGAQGPQGAAGAGSGDLVSTNNLSDVTTPATAFDNIKQDATASYKGAVELATNAEAQAGTDTARAVTAANIASMIGAQIQAYSARLAEIAALTPTDSNLIVGNGSGWVAESGATLRTSLGLGTGDSPQLTALNVGHATDTTITRVSAGLIAVEGVDVVLASLAQTLTNKTLGATTLSGALSAADQVIGRPELKDYAETVVAHGNSGAGTEDFDFEAGNVHTVTITGGTVNATFSHPPATGKAGSITIIITNGGSQTVNWPASVDWAGGAPPSLTAAGVDIVSFLTVDGGTNYYGFVGGLDFS